MQNLLPRHVVILMPFSFSAGSLTFSSSFLTVLRLALKSTDSLTLAPRSAPSMASAEIFTLFRAGLFIFPLSSEILWDSSAIWGQQCKHVDFINNVSIKNYRCVTFFILTSFCVIWYLWNLYLFLIFALFYCNVISLFIYHINLLVEFSTQCLRMNYTEIQNCVIELNHWIICKENNQQRWCGAL